MSLRNALLLLLALLPVVSPGETVGYRLKANDQIHLSVFGEADMSSEVTLTAAGEASLPFIGAVTLGGKTLKEAEELVDSLYRGDYLVEPNISINLLTAAEERVTVMGAVTKPGPVGIPPNTTLDLVSAIYSAGGLAPEADLKRVELKRGDTTKEYSLEKLRQKGAAPVMLAHGDKISVPTHPFANKQVTILGKVAKPGGYPFPPGGELDVTTLVGLAGDITEEADPERITVKRGANIYSAGPAGSTSRLQPGDIVTVPKHPLADKFVTMMGKVSKPGPVEFPLHGKLDVITAISHAGGFDRMANEKKVVVIRRVEGVPQRWTLNIEEMAEGKTPLFQLRPDDMVDVPLRKF